MIDFLKNMTHRALILLAGFLWVGVAQPQTAAQLQLFNQLPSSERQKVLGQLGLGGQSSSTGTTLQPAGDVVVHEPARVSAGAASELSKANPEELQPFGYQLFRAQPTTFAPVSDVPVPADYVLGPGDNLQLNLFGKESGSYTLTVDRSGQVFLPEIGLVAVAGMRFAEARDTLLGRISDSRIGVSASLAMGELRSIRIFVAGDARNPGSYTVSGLASMTQALYVSGGVQEIGSLRRVQLKRGGQTITELDLYDLLLRGDSSADSRLQAGDVVFIPPVGKTVGVAGAVRRPAVYELLDENRVEELLELAGGLLPGAVVDRVTVERVDNGRRNLLAADARGARLDLKSGDRVRILAPVARAEDGVELIGPARWPGAYALTAESRVSSVLGSADDLNPLTDLDFALILRRSDSGAGLAPIYVNPRRVFAGQVEADIPLRAGDELHVFPLQTPPSNPGVDLIPLSAAERRLAKSLGLSEVELARQKQDAIDDELLQGQVGSRGAPVAAAVGAQVAQSAESASATTKEAQQVDRAASATGETPARDQRIADLVERLRALAREGAPAPVVEVVGAVRFPGVVPLDLQRNGVGDVLRAAGGLADGADTGFVEVSRAPMRVSMGEPARRLIARIDSAELQALRLYPGDTIAVRQIPGAADERTVSILGEVLYPGAYRVAEGTTLTELVARAGGITASGFSQGAVFTRNDLRRKEEEQVQRLRDRLRGDLAAAALTKAATSPQAAAGLQTLSGLFEELAQYQALGRLVINLDAQLANRAEPLTLEDGDTLIVPKTPEEVTVIGEVQFPTSHRWEKGSRSRTYLERSGGFTNMADDRRTFIVRADGSVESARGGWFSRSPEMQPGDVIVVPLDATPIEPLTLFSSVTQIIYQLALTVAAFNSVGAF